MENKNNETGRFCELLTEALEKEIEKSGEDIKVVHRTITKVNEVLRCINLEPAGGGLSCSPNFYIDEYYALYEEGASVESIADIIFRTYCRNSECPHICEDEDFTDSGRADGIVLMLINGKGNEDLLDRIPHRDFLDLKVIYRVVLSSDDKGIASFILNNQVMDMWDMTEDEVFERALAQTQDILPPSDFIGMELAVFTNTSGINGDSAMLYPERLKRAADWFDSDLYIIPSSIHEIIAMPMEGVSDIPVRATIENAVNDGIISGAEWLSDSLYKYDRETGLVTVM